MVPINLVPGVTLASGTLSYSPAANLNDVRVLNPDTTGSGQIGTLDTTLLPNGAYWLVLVATDSTGKTQTSLAYVTCQSPQSNPAQAGRFSDMLNTTVRGRMWSRSRRRGARGAGLTCGTDA